MKIGTDSVILGAWASVNRSPYSILDIGAGTGVLAMMLAQRTSAEIIDAVEVDATAYEQCVYNFEHSPWSNRLFCYHASLQVFADEIEDKYELIISNPPFYTEDYKSLSYSRDLARFNDALPFEHLLESVSKLLSETGQFTVIIPFQKKSDFISLASHYGLFPKRTLNVKGNLNSPIKRCVLEFSFDKNDMSTEELIIETERHQYTKEYIHLTKDFYLKM